MTIYALLAYADGVNRIKQSADLGDSPTHVKLTNFQTDIIVAEYNTTLYFIHIDTLNVILYAM